MTKTETVRENFVIDVETAQTFHDLATARGVNKSELFRQMVRKEAKTSKELLQKWRELEELRKE